MLAVFFLGVVLGSILSMVVLYTVGRYHAKKAIEQVDRKVKNVLYNNLNN